MKNFRSIEKIMLAFGTLLFTVGIILFSFYSDQLAVWLNLQDSKVAVPIGKVEITKNTTRRKMNDSSTFLPIAQSQTIFLRDSVMTGSDSALSLSLNSGGVIELDSDTLIEIKYSDSASGVGQSEFVINVKKGKVVGHALHTPIKVVQANGETFVLASVPWTPTPSPTPNPNTPTPTATPSPTPQTSADCKINNLKVHSPSETKFLLPRLTFDLVCEITPSALSLSILNEAGESIWTHPVDFKASKQAKIDLTLNHPGNYLIKGNEVAKLDVPFTVPAHYAELVLPTVILSCDHRLSFKMPGNLKNAKGQIALKDADTKRDITSRKWQGVAEIDNLTYTSLFRRKVEAILKLDTGFDILSNRVDANQFPYCIATTQPRKNESIPLDKSKKQLFTWAKKPNETYQFTLAKDIELKNVVFRKNSTINFVTTAIDSPGDYYWQVMSSSGERSEPLLVHFH